MEEIEVSRVLTDEDVKRLEELYLTKEDEDEIKDYVNKNLLGKKDWRDNFHHLDIYNRVNAKNGMLAKLEMLRQKPSSHTVEELIEMLYIMGYSTKRIIFLCWEWGFHMNHRRIVNNWIKKKRTRLNIQRREFMAQVEQVKVEVFQQCQVEVRESEKETVNIYLNKIKDLQAALLECDPVTEPSKFKRISSMIEAIQVTLNKVHGVDALRDTVMRVAGQRAINGIGKENDPKFAGHVDGATVDVRAELLD